MDGNMSLSPRLAITAANHWRSGSDTNWIAKRLGVRESEIYNNLGQIKELAKHSATELEEELGRFIIRGGMR